MDVAYNQHSPFQRHHSHSHTNLNHLTLVPLTSRLPLSDPDDLPSNYSYIEGRSAPTTPSILSRSTSRVSMRKSTNLDFPKSKSSTHLPQRNKPRSGTTTPNGSRLRNTSTRDGLALSSLSAKDRSNSDWLLRAGATLSTSARESKGQTWLVSRASSTSLTGQGDDEEEFDREILRREREQNSRRGSRRGSTIGDADDEFSPLAARRSLSFGTGTGLGSRPGSRSISRYGSRRGSKASLFTPMNEREGYFDRRDFPHEELPTEPDFVEAEEESETEEEAKLDEAMVRKLARANSLGLTGWVEKMLGWSLFAVDEDGEDNDNEATDDTAEESGLTSRASRQTLDGGMDTPNLEIVPPLQDDEEAGGWQDAAWLLSVATRVLL